MGSGPSSVYFFFRRSHAQPPRLSSAVTPYSAIPASPVPGAFTGSDSSDCRSLGMIVSSHGISLVPPASAKYRPQRLHCQYSMWPLPKTPGS